MPEISQILRKGVLCDLKDAVARKLLDRKYTLPALGIPMTDLSKDVRDALANAGAVYDVVSSIPAWALKPNKPTYTAQEVGALPSSTVIPTVPTKLSAFINDVGFVTSFEESDPTVPEWAKQQNKPSYTASEVGALPSTTHIPVDPVNADWNASSGLAQILNKPTLFSGNYNDLTNKPSIPSAYDDTALSGRVSVLEGAGFLTTETDPTVPSWAKASSKPTYTASEVGAQPTIPFIEFTEKPSTNCYYGAGSSSYITDGQLALFRFEYGETLADQVINIEDKFNRAKDYNLYYASETMGHTRVGASTFPRRSTILVRFKANLGWVVCGSGTRTVPDWAAASTKPSYTASEVGALPDTTVIPPALSAGNGINIDSNAIKTTGIPFGICDDTSTDTNFTVTVPGIYKLEDGVCCMVKNGVVTSASGFTLNVNGLGGKPCYSNLAAATRDTTLFNVNYTMLFVYDSTRVEDGCWICYRGYDANTNTIGYQVRSNSYSLPATHKFYRYRLLFTSADGSHFVPANTSTSTNATASRTVNQEPINPFGTIAYYGTTAAVDADARPSVSSLWVLYTLNLGYSFNRTGAALTLTSWAPVYVKCAPQTNGSAIIDSTTPYVQALPTTDDGNIYIFLGVAYSATNIELSITHPVYYYDGTGIRLWTGARYYTKAEVDALLSALSS